MSSGRKRVVQSCVPCYTRKQKCNRQYPCNHCARRRCAEECAYYSITANQASSPIEPRKGETRGEKERCPSVSLREGCSAQNPPAPAAVSSCNSPLTELFGYFVDSDSNTLALIRKLGLGADDASPVLPPEAADEVNRTIEEMPARQTLNFLIQLFVAEINWMDYLVHPPRFLARYRSWWALERVTLVVEVDFAVLLLRICSYASQFLPSPSYTLDRVRGVLLSDIRSACDEVADSLAAISSAVDGRGSLVRVQHLVFFGLRCQMEGRRDAFWDALSRAIRIAQSVGIHSEAANARPGVDEIEKEMGRRTFCNLYVLDSLLSRQLDRIPFLPGCLNPGNWPQMNLGTLGDGNGTEPAGDAPEPFTERLLQARLADFWRRVGPTAAADVMVADERYELFCREYLAELPPAFALQPNRAWDKHLPKLPLQRQLLHIAIYDSLCWNFRPFLLRLSHEPNLPAYKRMLLYSQKQALVVAALHVLDGVSKLHAMLGGCHTRFAGLVFSTFEAAVLLVYLCMDPLLPTDDPPADGSSVSKNSKVPDPLRAADMRNIARQGCIEAVQGALDRLRMLAEVSNMADVGASILTQLLSKVSTITTTTASTTRKEEIPQDQNQQTAGDMASCFSFSPTGANLRDDLMSKGDLSTAMDDMMSWPSFDASEYDSQDNLMSMGAMQGSQNSWVMPIAGSN